MNYLLGVFLTYAGYVAYMGNLADFAAYGLGLSEDDYTTGNSKT